ncbi:hypothetical protein BD410DRAFT_223482 [Rickenella mellea]|uniref:Uncharacterized protein n=1 Tax=Rickenella mellea TaxID=50990 RepID=A0A4Y7QMI6_9AGAM|nr:hypothetical protein BD410DRAFT_223482 [Rickenella mellea]
MKSFTLHHFLTLAASSLSLLSFVSPQSTTGSVQASGSNQPSPSLQRTTSTTTSVGIGPNHQPTTAIVVTTFDITPAPAATGNSSGTGNNTASTNGTAAGNATASPSTSTPSNFPTAPANVDGGGNGPNGAPSPGASSPNGVYGPPDSFTAAAMMLRANAALLGAIGMAIGGWLVLA